jgi:recombination protein RecA
MYNEGISLSGDLLDTAVVFKVINKSGNSYNYGETKLGVGRETAKRFLKENPKLMAEIRAKVIKSSEAAAENTEDAPVAE